MLYTNIELSAPASASPGEMVEIEVRIINMWNVGFEITAVAVLNRDLRFIDWRTAWIEAGQDHTFPGTFVMPDGDALIEAYSYYQTPEGEMIRDDLVSHTIKAEILGEAAFANLQVTYGRV